MDYDYDAANRLDTLAILDRRLVDYMYDPVTGLLDSVITLEGVGLTLGYVGDIHARETWSGPVLGIVSETPDADRRLLTQLVNDG